jgi:hypothetical protein
MKFLLTALYHAFALIFTGVCYLQIAPRLISIWMDFELELAPLSVSVIKISQGLQRFWYLGFGFLLFDLTLLFLLSRTPSNMRWLYHFWTIVVLLGCLALMILLIVGGVVPTVRLLNELDG